MPVFDLDTVSVSATTDSELEIGVVGNESLIDAELEFGFTSDATASAAAVPRTVDEQAVCFEVYLNGVRVDPYSFTSEIAVQRSYNNRLQTWNWSVALDSVAGPVGSPFTCVGPGTGTREVSIYGVYLTSTGVHRIPLIQSGIASDSSRSASTTAGRIERFEGVDRGGRFDRALVDINFPVGHGLRRGVVVRKTMAEAGETNFALEAGETMMKEFRLSDEVALDPCAELLETENRRLFWNRSGEMVNPRIGKPRPEEPVVFGFTPRDLLGISEVTINHHADVITEVIAYGQEQLPAPDCGDVTIETVVEEEAIYAPARPTYYQKTDETFDTQAAAPDGTLRVVRKTVTAETKRCGTTVLKVTDVWEWYNPECARFFWNGTAWKPLNCFVYENSLSSSSPAYAWSEERFVLKTRTVEGTAYHKGGFEIVYPGAGIDAGIGDTSIHSGDEVMLRAIRGTQTDGEFGYGVPNVQGGMLQGTWSRVFGYYQPKTAVKQRNPAASPLVPWDEIDPTGGCCTNGSGDGVYEGAGVTTTPSGIGIYPETFRLVSANAIGHWPDLRIESGAEVSDGYLVRNEKAVAQFARKPGDGFLFGNQQSYSVVAEELLWWTNTTTDYSGDKAKNTHSEVTTRRQFDNNLINPSSFGNDPAVVTSSNLAGYLPAIGRMETAPVNDAVYESDAEFDESFVGSLRSDTGKLFAHVIATGLLTCHLPHKEVLEFSWAETLAELEQLCSWVIEESAAATVRFKLPANFFVEPGMVVHLEYDPLGLDHDMRISSVVWSHGGVPPLTTDVEAMLYGW